ncbi:TRAP transporter small permease [Desulfitibacter alkalitolerans]|uniref:TRAP transporter small permease n=1 Tax=Desulfitibacter alkalitolerans TaxID=264641 RepID=UPI000687655E|nr:TRAP transporter small permease [Desulfitibacter alkalitolerans]
MNKIAGFIDNFEENLIAILLPLMVLLVFAATFFRYTGLLILPWAEELARYMMIWIIYLGIGTGAKKNSHFAVEAFYKLMPQKTHKYFKILRTIIIIVFCTTVIGLSTKLIKAQMAMGQSSPSLGIPIWVAYLAVPIGCTLMALRSVQYIILQWRDNRLMDLDKVVK